MDTFSIDLIVLLTTTMLACYWFNYVLGQPLSDAPDTTAIGAWIPRYLADERLLRAGLLSDYTSALQDALAVTRQPLTHHELRRDNRRDRLLAGRTLFTWERSLLCPVCLHWWLTLLVCAVILTFDLLHAQEHVFLLVSTYFLNHFFIRKI